MEVIIFIVATSVLMVIIVALYRYNNRKQNSIFSRIANRFQLTFEETKGFNLLRQKFPSAYGTIEGVGINIDMYIVSSGNSHVEYSRISLTLSGDNHKDLCLTKESFFGKVGKLIGMQDIIVGRSDMDDQFIIKSSDDNYAKYILNSTVCAYLKQMSFKGSLKVENKQLTYTEVGIPRNDNKLDRFYSNIQNLVKAAKEMK